MPFIDKNNYEAPFYYGKNAHWQTIFPSLFRKIKGVNYQRERWQLPDGDFLDADFAKVGSKNLAIVVHGLEGNAHRHYVQGTVKTLNAENIDVLAYNCRSCSGEMNLLPRLYHHADTPDLRWTIQKMLPHYEKIALVGYSLGGNIVLKYLAEQNQDLDTKIKTAFVVSVPCHLPDCVALIEQPQNKVYKKKFLKKLSEKIRIKAQNHPQISAEHLKKVRTFIDFDNFYTAPLHGFQSAQDYYHKAATIFVLDQIQIPVYLLSAQNDPLLSNSCFPIEWAKKSPFFHFELSPQGGHVGFEILGNELTYAEIWAAQWIKNFL